MQCKYYGNCKHQNESCKSNTALLKCVYGLNEYCTEKAWEIDALREENDTLKTEIMAVKSGSDVLKIRKLEEENKELKRLLKMAIESFDYIDKEFGCAGCHKGWEKCPYNTGEKDCCTEKWKYYDEAMKLIGELTMAEKLRECPFCGSKVEVTRGMMNAPFLFFKCTNLTCGAVISFDNSASNSKPRNAKDNWNRRADNGKV